MIQCSVSAGRILVRFPYQPEVVELCKTIPGARWQKGIKAWTFSASRNAATQICNAIVGHHEVETDNGFEQLMVGEPTDPSTEVPATKTPCWVHQKRSFWFAADIWRLNGGVPSGGAMLALGMGCGKTKVAFDLIKNFGFQRTLVISPAKVVNVWPIEHRKHCDPLIQVVPLSRGTTTERAELLEKFVETTCHPFIVITNYEATRQKKLAQTIKKISWDLIVLDEIHRIKAPGGTDSRWLETLGQRVPCRLGLTGTPMPKGPEDLYAQFRFLDDSIFGRSFAQFRAEYAIMGGFDNLQIVAYRNKDELSARFSRIAIQIRTEDVLDLPDENHIERSVELGDEALRIYEQLEKEFVVWVSEGVEVSVHNALTKLLKLQEITGGFLRDPDTKEVHRIGREKADLLKDILEDLVPDEPVVVACRFRPDLAIVGETARAMGRTVSELSGARNELAQWQRGQTNILVCQIQSGKEGIDLTRSRYAILYSAGFSYGDHEQFLRRLRRPGQRASTVNYIHLIAEGTVDRQIYRAIARKERVIESILREVRKHHRIPIRGEEEGGLDGR